MGTEVIEEYLIIVAMELHQDLDLDEKYERRRGASLPASSIFKNYNTVLRNNF